jgi:hypothetical protein
MKDNINTRTAQVLINGGWQDIEPIDIKEGMTIRMFEPDEKPVLGVDGSTEFVAKSEVYYLSYGVIGFDC